MYPDAAFELFTKLSHYLKQHYLVIMEANY